tara:strand:+ start:390 stop:536 length:147 start_codon:yes stop_codon:yes gene_type:complete
VRSFFELLRDAFTFVRTVGALSFADGAAASEAGAATCVLDESAGMAAK